MIKYRRRVFAVAVAATVMMGGCRLLPGRKISDFGPPGAAQAVDFQSLYSANCAACHGQGGSGSVAVALASPVYLAISDKDVIQNAIADGGPGKLSPAFSRSAGGLLSDQEIAVLTDGIMDWRKPGELAEVSVPPRSQTAAGNATRGAAVYATFCASCHGPGGSGGKAGSIVDPAFLALLSDQDLRTLVIVGLPQFGAPDWRNDVPGHPMNDQQIGDVVAWLASHRVPYPGQPFLESSNTNNTGGKQ